jgi:hypothetical protein
MNKKQLALLVQTMVLSTQASINKNAESDDAPLTEDEARTLLALRLRKATRSLVAEASGCEADAVVIAEPAPKAKKAAKTAK